MIALVDSEIICPLSCQNMSFSETKTLPELEKELRTQGFEGHSAQEVQDAWITVKRSWYRNS